MELNNNLRKLRFNHNEMSQQQLAELIGVTRMTVYSIEKGKYIPSALIALKIAQVFNVTVEEVFYLEQGKKESEHNENEK
ncbi:MAG: helix-turn-helix transcriptional regulator [Clostridia bacterium]|nr:helix-turn-helix transcriptional regulator [Clostridia bacterium]